MEKSVGKLLKSIRKSKHITQNELGKKLGISRSKISSWEVGRRDMSVSDIVELSNYYDICIDCILNNKNITLSKVTSLLQAYINTHVFDEKDEQTLRDKFEELLKHNTSKEDEFCNVSK